MAASLNLPIMDHALDDRLARGGVMHEGAWSDRWNLPGIPAEAEFKVVARDVRLALKNDCAIHIQHVSDRASVN